MRRSRVDWGARATARAKKEAICARVYGLVGRKERATGSWRRPVERRKDFLGGGFAGAGAVSRDRPEVKAREAPGGFK